MDHLWDRIDQVWSTDLDPFCMSKHDHHKAWNKQYCITVCDIKYAYCDTTLHSDLKRKEKKRKQFFLKIKYGDDPWFILVTLKYNNITANTSKFNSKSIKLQKSEMFAKIAPQFRKVLYKWTPQEAKLMQSISSLASSGLVPMSMHSRLILDIISPIPKCGMHLHQCASAPILPLFGRDDLLSFVETTNNWSTFVHRKTGYIYLRSHRSWRSRPCGPVQSFLTLQFLLNTLTTFSTSIKWQMLQRWVS
jgi:hypothetical protein